MFPEIEVLKEKENNQTGSPWCGLGRVLECVVVAPPSPPVPMVFLMRNYVRVTRVSPLGWDWGGRRIATRAQIAPGGLFADYPERNKRCPGFEAPNWLIALRGCSVLLPREPLYVPPFGGSVPCFH